jgi:DNA invertase Pin-like site-specific DNA recombinase
VQRAALYSRVSKDDRLMNPENQVHVMREFCIRRGWKTMREYPPDFASAADLRGRKHWRQVMEDAERGRFDVLLVAALDRAFRSTIHAADALRHLEKCGVALVSVREEWADGTTAQGRLMRTMLVAFAEFEREQTKARTRAWAARRRAEGLQLGRPSKLSKLNGEWDHIRPLLLRGSLGIREAAERLHVSPRTIARALRQNGGPTGAPASEENQASASGEAS